VYTAVLHLLYSVLDGVDGFQWVAMDRGRKKVENTNLMRYAFCCRLQTSLAMPNLSFSGRRGLSTGLQLPHKDQIARQVYRWGRKASSFPKFWLANIELLGKTCHENQLFIPSRVVYSWIRARFKKIQAKLIGMFGQFA